MAILRLFANLREAAGTSNIEIPGETVGDVLAEAERRFGDRFAAGLTTARVWVNGEQADPTTSVSDRDEVALIPPVSGGATATRLGADPNVLPLVLLTALIIAAWIPPRWFVIVAAGAVLAWAWDLHDTAAVRGTALPLYPLMVAPVAGAVAAYAWGLPGYAGGVAFAILLSAAWPVFDAAARPVPTMAVTMTVTTIGAIASGALVLLKLTSTTAVVAFVIVTVVGVVAAALAQVYGTTIQSIDPNVGALLGALVAGVVVGSVVSGIELAAAMLAAVFGAAGLIAGRAFGSILRLGAVVHTVRPPGRLSVVDGIMVAAPLFWLALWVFG